MPRRLGHLPPYCDPRRDCVRQTLIELHCARQSSEGQQTKMELVYQYLTGPRFRHRVEAIVEKFGDMKADLDKERKTMTKLGEFHCTPAFMAPEQLARNGSVDGKLSDVYSLGRLLLFMTSGLEAIRKTSPVARAKGAKPTQAPATRPSTPPIADRRIRRVYLKACDLRPAQRYQSAGELADDLRQIIRRNTLLRRSRVLAIAAMVAIFAGGGTWMTGQTDAALEDQRGRVPTGMFPLTSPGMYRCQLGRVQVAPLKPIDRWRRSAQSTRRHFESPFSTQKHSTIFLAWCLQRTTRPHD